MPLHGADAGFRSTGSALTQPQAPSRGAPVPQEQLGLWQNFQNKLRTDPDFRMAMLTAGLNMLRTPQIGETGFDTFASGALTGVQTLDQLRQREAGTEREGRQDVLAERRVEATESQAETAATSAQQTGERFERSHEVAVERTQLLRDQLDFERDKFRDIGGTTGPERILSGAVDALVGSGRYEDTPEGRANARVFASGLSGELSSRDLLNATMSRIDVLSRQNILLDEPLSAADIAREAFEDVQSVAGFFRIPERQSGVDELDGAEIILPFSEEGGAVEKGTIRKVQGKDDAYVIEFEAGGEAGVSREYTREQILKIKERAESAPTS